jgi:hypothetical protein
VLVTVPGERREVEFMDDGTIEVERFKSSGSYGRDRWADLRHGSHPSNRPYFDEN